MDTYNFIFMSSEIMNLSNKLEFLKEKATKLIDLRLDDIDKN